MKSFSLRNAQKGDRRWVVSGMQKIMLMEGGRFQATDLCAPSRARPFLLPITARVVSANGKLRNPSSVLHTTTNSGATLYENFSRVIAYGPLCILELLVWATCCKNRPVSSDSSQDPEHVATQLVAVPALVEEQDRDCGCCVVE